MSSSQSRRKKRRAFSVPESGGRIRSGGAPKVANELVRALLQAPRDPRRAHRLTHSVHSYPARMHPATAKVLVSLTLHGVDQGMLLDPFCGSGTTLVEARCLGAKLWGVDANPLAVAISATKLWSRSPKRRADAKRLVHSIVDNAIVVGKQARHAGVKARRHWSPPGLDAGLRSRRIATWFAPHVRRELEYILEIVHKKTARDPELLQVLQVILSSILYKVSKRESDTDERKIERKIGRGAPARLFRARFDLFLQGAAALAAYPAMETQLVVGDARQLLTLGIPPASIDAVVTSPPYAGVYDYHAHHQLRMDFLGMEGQEFAGQEMASRRQFRGGNKSKAIRAWQDDLATFFSQMAVVLRPKGKAVIMLGDSLLFDQALDAGQVVQQLVSPPLRVVAWAAQERNALGAREHTGFASRPKREHLIALTRDT